MTQPIIYGCNHGFAPGECTDRDCRNSSFARSLYTSRPTPSRVPAPSPILPQVLRFAGLVAAEYAIDQGLLLGPRKFTELNEARHVLYWLCCRAGGWSGCSVGRALKRHSQSVNRGVANIERRRATNERLAQRLERLLQGTEAL